MNGEDVASPALIAERDELLGRAADLMSHRRVRELVTEYKTRAESAAIRGSTSLARFAHVIKLFLDVVAEGASMGTEIQMKGEVVGNRVSDLEEKLAELKFSFLESRKRARANAVADEDIPDLTPLDDALEELLSRREVARERLHALKVKVGATPRDGGSDGPSRLHILDYEQLRTESTALTEKIEVRQREIEKLTARTAEAVHAHTHHRERLRATEASLAALTSQLAAIDEKVTSQRDAVVTEKRQRDALTVSNAQLRSEVGDASDGGAVSVSRDMQLRQVNIRNLEKKRTELQRELDSVVG